MRVRILTLVTVILALALSTDVVAQSPAPLLAKVSAYLNNYEKEFAGVVSEEYYRQSVTTNQGDNYTTWERALKSDVIVLNLPGADGNAWTVFRDVFEVDAKPVRDRDTRLQKLFVDTPGQALVQAQKIMDDGARYNMGTVKRNINVPTMALTYVRGPNQARSKFQVAGIEKLNTLQASILTFTEFASPTVIRADGEDQPATGRFWVEPDTGRILKTELSVKSLTLTARITVTYVQAPTLTVWVPATMKEEYATHKGSERMKGDATYSNFHQFKVSTDMIIKKDGPR